MKTNYFNSSVIKPLVPASAQNAAFVDGDIVFDWTGFEIPRGTSKLLGATIKIRSKGDAGSTVQPAGVDLLFAKGPVPDATPTSLGTANAEVTNFGSTDIIGAMPYATADSFGLRTLYQSTVSSSELVLEPNSDSGDNVGVDKFYVAGLAAGALDFRSAVTVDGTPGTGQANLDVEDLNPNLFMVVGDVVHDEDDRLMGTISVFTDANNVGMAANLANAGVNDKLIYNINPIEIILHFQK
tara:strand:- start:67 stop:786 length:720 start_codon:yes stop_codon:yes gene_type:complete